MKQLLLSMKNESPLIWTAVTSGVLETFVCLHKKTERGLLSKSELTEHRAILEEGQIILDRIRKNENIGVLALMIALLYKQHAAVEHLILETNINARGPNDITPLMLASLLRNSSKAAQKLISSGADVNAKLKNGTTALILASGFGSERTVHALIQAGATIEQQATVCDLNLNKILHFLPLTSDVNEEMVKILLNCDGNSPKYPTLLTALMTASILNPPVIKQLLDARTSVETPGFLGRTAVMFAASQGHLSTVKLLHQYGANLNHLLEDRRNALILAAENGHLPIVNFLYDLGLFDIEHPCHNGATALILASKKNHGAVVQFLLEKGANPDAKITGITALMIAAKHDHPNIARLLIKHKANVLHSKMAHSSRIDKVTALTFAAASGSQSIVEQLIMAGACNLPSGPFPNYETWLFMETQLIDSYKLAVDYEHFEIAMRLFEIGIESNSSLGTMQCANSLLMSVCESGGISCVKAMLEKLIKQSLRKRFNELISNAIPNSSHTPQGGQKIRETPLFLALKNGHFDICEHLIIYGADVESSLAFSVAQDILTESTNYGFSDETHWLLRVYYNRSLPANLDAKKSWPIRYISDSEDLCPLTCERPGNPVTIKSSKSQSIYDLKSLLQWLIARNTDPMTNLPLPAESLGTSAPKSVSRFMFILKNAFGFPIVKSSMRIVANLGSSLCLRLKRLSSGRKKYQARILQAAICRYKERPVVLLQRRFRGKQLFNHLQEQSHQQHAAHAPGSGRFYS